MLTALALALTLLAMSCFALVKPLENRLALMAREVELLDPDSDKPPLTIKGDDELTALARHINAMAGRISALLRSQRELNQAVSHELKTPLSKLKFHRELAQLKLAKLEADHEGAVSAHLESMASNIEQLSSLVEEILFYSRLENSTPPLTWQRTALVSVIEQCWDELDKHREGRYLQLDVGSLTCYADRFYLNRALYNLLSNACRYGAQQVQVNACEQDEKLVINVDDDGEGIPELQRDKVLEPFYRIDASRNRALGGTGLGLPIVVQIARWHGGVLNVSTSPLGGARFSLVLPQGALTN